MSRLKDKIVNAFVVCVFYGLGWPFLLMRWLSQFISFRGYLENVADWFLCLLWDLCMWIYRFFPEKPRRK